MKSENNDVNECGYRNCVRLGENYHEELQEWLCDEHIENVADVTGWCSDFCRLGHGCDGSC